MNQARKLASIRKAALTHLYERQVTNGKWGAEYRHAKRDVFDAIAGTPRPRWTPPSAQATPPTNPGPSTRAPAPADAGKPTASASASSGKPTRAPSGEVSSNGPATAPSAAASAAASSRRVYAADGRPTSTSGRFDWGFEALFFRVICGLHDEGIVEVRAAPGAVAMVGGSGGGQRLKIRDYKLTPAGITAVETEMGAEALGLSSAKATAGTTRPPAARPEPPTTAAQASSPSEWPPAAEAVDSNKDMRQQRSVSGRTTRLDITNLGGPPGGSSSRQEPPSRTDSAGSAETSGPSGATG